MKSLPAATVAQLAEFDEIIDVRTPAEFAEDHIPGALNYPVLDNEQRARIGTLYKQVSPFEAKKLGAALIARNIAQHIEQSFLAKPKAWKPLIYCWRGGKRSAAMVHILREIGWKAGRLEGGYQGFRRALIADLQTWLGQFQWRVVCGLTGSGKSRLLQALHAQGAQVLDLEQLAAHRGSVLGNLPDAPQPSQKMFDSLIWDRLRQFQPGQPVYVEAESKKIGSLHLPEALLAAMWQASCVGLEADPALRVALLREEYAHFLEQPQMLKQQLEHLAGLYGRRRIGDWNAMIDAGRWDELVAQLLLAHYDPAYSKSTLKHYPQLQSGILLRLTSLDAPAFARLAQQILAA